jgi:hypothetical protein
MQIPMPPLVPPLLLPPPHCCEHWESALLQFVWLAPPQNWLKQLSSHVPACALHWVSVHLV